MRTEYYELKKVEKTDDGWLTTAAFRFCGLCSGTIDTMGGPGYGSICIKCGEALKNGQLRGCVSWDEAPPPPKPPSPRIIHEGVKVIPSKYPPDEEEDDDLICGYVIGSDEEDDEPKKKKGKSKKAGKKKSKSEDDEDEE